MIQTSIVWIKLPHRTVNASTHILVKNRFSALNVGMYSHKSLVWISTSITYTEDIHRRIKIAYMYNDTDLNSLCFFCFSTVLFFSIMKR